MSTGILSVNKLLFWLLKSLYVESFLFDGLGEMFYTRSCKAANQKYLTRFAFIMYSLSKISKNFNISLKKSPLQYLF